MYKIMLFSTLNLEENMQCSEEGCVIVKKLYKRLFDEEHGVFAQLTKIMLLLKDKVPKKAAWTLAGSLLGTIVFVIIFFATVWADGRDIKKELPEIKSEIKDIEEKDNRQDNDIVALKTKQDVIYANTEKILEALDKIKK